MKSFVATCMIFILAIALLNAAIMLSDTKAAGKTTYNAGLQLKDREGKVIGCECPTTNGTCICAHTVQP